MLNVVSVCRNELSERHVCRRSGVRVLAREPKRGNKRELGRRAFGLRGAMFDRAQ